MQSTSQTPKQSLQVWIAVSHVASTSQTQRQDTLHGVCGKHGTSAMPDSIFRVCDKYGTSAIADFIFRVCCKQAMANRVFRVGGKHGKAQWQTQT